MQFGYNICDYFQGDLNPLEILFRSITFSPVENEKTGAISRKTQKLPPVARVRTPSPPRAAPAPVPEPSRDGSSAFSWMPSLLPNRKAPPKTADSSDPQERRKHLNR